MVNHRQTALTSLAGQALGPALQWALTEYDGNSWDVVYSEAAHCALGVAKSLLEAIDVEAEAVRLLHAKTGNIYFVSEDTMTDIESGKAVGVCAGILLECVCYGRAGDGFHVMFKKRSE